MNAILHEKKLIAIIIALLTVACGVLFLIYGLDVAALLCRIVGAVLALIGLFYVIAFLSRKKGPVGTWMEMLAGLVCIAVGIWMLVSPRSAIKYIQYVAALVILAHGVLDLQATIALIRTKTGSWLYALLLSVLTLGLGLWILLKPYDATRTLMILIGIVLIIDGISDLFIIGGLSRAVRTVKRETEKARQEMEAIETDGTVDGVPVTPEEE